MTTLDLVDLSTSLPSPICEGATLHALHPSAAVVHQESPTLSQVQSSALGDGTSALGDGNSALGDSTSALGDSTRVGDTVPLVLPTVEVPQRRERTGTSCSLQRTTWSKNQPKSPKGDSPSRKRARGRSAVPQGASSRETLSNMQQLSSEW